MTKLLTQIAIFHLFFVISLLAISKLPCSIDCEIKFFPGRPVLNFTWFFNLNCSDLKKYHDSIDPSQLSRTLLTKRKFNIYCAINPSCLLQSNVYTGLFRNAYLGRICSVENSHIKLYKKDVPVDYQMKIVGFYDVGIAYVQHYWQWGHVIHDFCSGLMYLPEHLKNVHVITLQTNAGYYHTIQWLNFLGYNATVLNLNNQEQVFVKELYFVTGCEHAHSVTIGGIKRLRTVVRNKLNLTTIKPTKYYVFNRVGRNLRQIHNHEQLLEALNKDVKLPDNQVWHYYAPFIKKIEYAAKFFAHIRAFICPSGSTVYNTIYMQEKTPMLLIFGHFDKPNIQLCLTSNLYMIGITIPLPKNLSANYLVNIPQAVTLDKKIVYCSEHGHWDNTLGLVHAVTKGDYNFDPIIDVPMKN